MRQSRLARAGAAIGEINPPVRNPELNMQRIMVAAAAAMLVTGAGILDASAQGKLKVGFVYLGPVGDFGWTYQHEVGRQAVVKALGDKIETTSLENVHEGPDP